MSLAKTAIISVLVLLLGPLLGGCNALRLGYNNGPFLAWWWLDGYVDFSREQAPAARQAIERFFDWHRATQLPEYAAVLATAQAQVLEPTTAAAVCRWQALLLDKLEPAIDHALVQAAELLPGLGEPQWRHLDQRYAKSIEEMREEYLQPDPVERLKAFVERALKGTEQLYGRLDEPQRRVVAAGVAASPFDPQAWLAERQRRQRDTLQTLRRLGAEHANADQRLAALRVLAQRRETSTNPDYRAYQQRLADYNCALGAQIHNATTASQRQKARETIKGWEEDLRALIGPPV